MLATVILVISIALQFIAAALALYLIRITGRWWAWGFIAVALTLMGVRRSITFSRIVFSDSPLPVDITAELLALTISVLMVLGVVLIGPVFKRVQQTQSALRESEARFRAIAEASPVPLIITRRSDGEILYANPKVGPAFGLAADQVIGRSITAFYWDASGREERLAALEKDGYVRDNEVEMRKVDGSRISTVHSLQVIEYQGEEAVFGGFYDITERRRAEEALKESEERVRGIIDNSPSAIYLKDTEGLYLLVNKRFEEWYGYSAAHSIGKSAYDLFPKHLADGYTEVDREVILSGQAREVEFEAPFADGTTRLISTTKFPVRDSHGHVIAVGTINTDITERKRTEEQLRQAQKMEAVGQLTGGVAHDFNNLLASILGHAEIVEEKLGADDESVKTIIRAAERGAQLTQRLLSFSRRQPLNSRSVNLRDLVGDVHQLLHRTLGETIDVDIVMPAALWNAVADPGQLENALLNLAINARDAMPDGGKLIVEAANEPLGTKDATGGMEVIPGDYVSLSVKDTGIGMSPEVMEHAFEPFFTTKDVGQGSGLGLSMVYGFAKQSGGDATIANEPGHGTMVKLFLPRARETVEQLTTEDLPSPPRGNGETVLVIEDDPDVRAMTGAMLENLGYRVLSAQHARAGLDILRAEPTIDLMLSDVVLPGGMSGPDMAEQARAFSPEIKVLFMSGHAEQSIHLRTALPEGCELLDKPFRTYDLAQRLRAVLDR